MIVCPPLSHSKHLKPRRVANDWVVAQTLNRRRRELEAEEAEYRERLLRARRREEAMKRIANERVVKRQVREPTFEGYLRILTCERN